MPFIFGMIISNKMATLKELKEYYSFDDAQAMLDIIITDNYNQQVMYNNMDNKK